MKRKTKSKGILVAVALHKSISDVATLRADVAETGHVSYFVEVRGDEGQDIEAIELSRDDALALLAVGAA